MAKFSGKIGYAEIVDSIERPGIWTEEIIERNHYGDVVKDYKKYESNTNHLNDTLIISNKLSIIADSFIINNAHKIRYVIFNNTRWNVVSLELNRPRILISIGGVYNGPLPNVT